MGFFFIFFFFLVCFLFLFWGLGGLEIGADEGEGKRTSFMLSGISLVSFTHQENYGKGNEDRTIDNRGNGGRPICEVSQCHG